MDKITVGDVVQVTNVPSDKEYLLNKTGVVIMVIDGEKYLVNMESGEGLTTDEDSLKRIS